MNTNHYIVEDPDLDMLAKEYLRAEINSERAYEHSGSGPLFKQYADLMGSNYIAMVRALGVEPGYVVTESGGGRPITVERIMRRTVLGVPDQMKPKLDGLKLISGDIYLSMRQQGLAEMGMDFLKKAKARSTLMPGS